jgi:hypothetical protein
MQEFLETKQKKEKKAKKQSKKDLMASVI